MPSSWDRSTVLLAVRSAGESGVTANSIKCIASVTNLDCLLAKAETNPQVPAHLLDLAGWQSSL